MIYDIYIYIQYNTWTLEKATIFTQPTTCIQVYLYSMLKLFFLPRGRALDRWKWDDGSRFCA